MMTSPRCKQWGLVKHYCRCNNVNEVLLHKLTYPDYQLQCSNKRGDHVWAAREEKNPR